VRVSCILFLIVVCIGHAIFSLGVSLYAYWLALLGRTVFGIGAESLNGKIYTVTQAFVVATWFKGQELTMAYGISITIGRLVVVVNDWTQPAIYNWTGDVVIGLWFGVILCLLSLICGIFLIIIDRKKDKALKVFAEASLEKKEKVKFSEIFKSDRRFWILCAINFTGYMCLLPFNFISSAFYQERFEFNQTEAGFIMVNFI
jgi:nitrate/nitrite transporter NarK